MSKIGEAVINLPPEVQFTVTGHTCTIKGKEGELKIDFPSTLKVEIVEQTVRVKRQRDDKKIKSLHGLYRSLLANAINGVQKPWEKKLEIIGTGFNAQLQGEDLIFKLGFSHSVIFK